MDPEVDNDEAPQFDYPPEFHPNVDAIKGICQMLGVHSSWVKKALFDLNNTTNGDAICDYIFQHNPRFEEVFDDAVDTPEEPKDNPKMVFVVNRELQMSTGKIASQVAQAATSLSEELSEKKVDLTAWKDTGSRKIVLQCDNGEAMLELRNLAVVRELPFHLVTDAGLTEIDSGSFTVLGIYGTSWLVDTVTGNLQTL